jgi:hypothetical protein
VTVASTWHGEPEHLAAQVTVAERRGCDIAPVDISDPDRLRMLESFIWPEQLDRIAQLRSAAALARQERPQLDRESATAWLPRHLDAPRAGTTTVVFHSIMWWYLSRPERHAVSECIRAAGSRATAEAPVAWLRLELRGREHPELRLDLWPGGGETLVLGQAHPHGREVWWGAAQS